MNNINNYNTGDTFNHGNQVIDNNQLVNQIKEVEKSIQEADRLRNEALTTKKIHEENLKQIEKELQDLGIDPNNIDQELITLQNEINENLNFINENLPKELLNNE